MKNKVSEETKKALKGVKSEIICNMVTDVKSESDLVHNKALKLTVEIIKSYIEGNGIYQLGE